MRNIRMTLAYRGTAYHGWQVQQNARSVCAAFQDGVEAVLGRRYDVKGCSRTDAGVHAGGFVLSVLCPEEDAPGIPSAPLVGNTSITVEPSTPTCGYTEVTGDMYYTGDYLGRIKIPSLGVNVKVYHGTDSSALAKGAGHFENTSIWEGNVCIAGHNRGAHGIFGDIHTLKSGDAITLTTKSGARTYSVFSVDKVKETDTSMLGRTVENQITLLTCVTGQSTYRWCVQAMETFDDRV